MKPSQIFTSNQRFHHLPRRIGHTAFALLATVVAALSLRAADQAPGTADTQHPTLYKTAKVEGLDIFYREAGPVDGPTLVLLHGFPTSSRMFRNLIPALSDRYHVIILIGLLIALHPVLPQAAALGSLLLVGMSLTTLSFLVTTPEAWVSAPGTAAHGFPFLAGPGRLVIKDAIMLGAAIVTLADSAKAVLRR